MVCLIALTCLSLFLNSVKQISWSFDIKDSPKLEVSLALSWNPSSLSPLSLPISFLSVMLIGSEVGLDIGSADMEGKFGEFWIFGIALGRFWLYSSINFSLCFKLKSRFRLESTFSLDTFHMLSLILLIIWVRGRQYGN